MFQQNFATFLVISVWYRTWKFLLLSTFESGKVHILSSFLLKLLEICKKKANFSILDEKTGFDLSNAIFNGLNVTYFS